MSGAPALSVACTTYNGAAWLAAQLESLRAQTRLPNELVVGDDGSHDATLDLLRDFAARAPFAVHVTRNPARLGPAQNFAAVIARCAGDWIALADQDDVWHPQKLARVSAVLASRPEVGAVVVNADLVDAELRPLGRTYWETMGFSPRADVDLGPGRAFEVLLRRSFAAGATMTFRAALRALVLPIPAGWVHDQWIALLAGAVSGVVGLAQPLNAYRQHAGQVRGARSPAVAPGAHVALARGLPRASYAAEAEALEALGQRLRGPDARPPLAVQPGVLERLERRRHHLLRRGAMPASRLRRLRAIAAEIANGGYWRESHGWRSILKDLWM